MKREKKIKIDKVIDVFFCDICGKEIDVAELPFEFPFGIKKQRRYDGKRKIKNPMDWLFKTPIKEKEFHFHYSCVEKAIFKAIKSRGK